MHGFAKGLSFDWRYRRIHPISDGSSSGNGVSPQSSQHQNSSPTTSSPPSPPVLSKDMASLLTRLMQHGETMESSGYFRCYYSNGVFSDNQAKKIVDFFDKKDMFCAITEDNSAYGPIHYLAFNKSEEELHNFLKDILPNKAKTGSIHPRR